MIRSINRCLFASVLGLSLTVLATKSAQACDECSCSLTPLSDTSLPLYGSNRSAAGTFRVGLMASMAASSVYSHNFDSQDTVVQNRWTPSLVWYPLDWLTLSASAPIVHQLTTYRLYQRQHGGLGDVETLARVRFFRATVGIHDHTLFASVGLLAPTAATQYSGLGNPLPLIEQLSRGVWEPSLSIGYQYSHPNVSLIANIAGRTGIAGRLSWVTTNSLSGMVTVLWKPETTLSVGAAARVSWGMVQQNIANRMEVSSTTDLHLAPTVVWQALGQAMLHLQIDIPVAVWGSSTRIVYPAIELGITVTP